MRQHTTETALEALRNFKKSMDISSTLLIDTAIVELETNRIPESGYSFEEITARSKEDFILKVYLLIVQMIESNAHGEYTPMELVECSMFLISKIHIVETAELLPIKVKLFQ